MAWKVLSKGLKIGTPILCKAQNVRKVRLTQSNKTISLLQMPTKSLPMLNQIHTYPLWMYIIVVFYHATYCGHCIICVYFIVSLPCNLLCIVLYVYIVWYYYHAIYCVLYYKWIIYGIITVQLMVCCIICVYCLVLLPCDCAFYYMGIF